MAVNQMTRRRRRPLGITILAFLLFLSTLLDLSVVVLSIFALTTGQLRFLAPRMTPAGELSEVLSVAILLALSILPLLLARGLWELRPWAYRGVVVLESINVAIGVISLINRQPERQTLLTLAPPVLILLYLLLDHNVHVAFSRRTTVS